MDSNLNIVYINFCIFYVNRDVYICFTGKYLVDWSRNIEELAWHTPLERRIGIHSGGVGTKLQLYSCYFFITKVWPCVGLGVG